MQLRYRLNKKRCKDNVGLTGITVLKQTDSLPLELSIIYLTMLSNHRTYRDLLETWNTVMQWSEIIQVHSC